jgi:hypothetical protein
MIFATPKGMPLAKGTKAQMLENLLPQKYFCGILCFSVFVAIAHGGFISRFSQTFLFTHRLEHAQKILSEDLPHIGRRISFAQHRHRQILQL